MVIGKSYVDKRKDFFFLKYFFWLWQRWISSGGRSFGKKVFWGLITYNKWFYFLVNRTYSIWNTYALIQLFFKPAKHNHTLGLVFYFDLGVFALVQVEQSHEINKFLTHSTTIQHGFTKGDSLVLWNSNIGLVLFALQRQSDEPAIIAWAAGCYVKVFKATKEKVFVQLPSLVLYSIAGLSSGTAGLSSKLHIRKMTKAGDSRHIFWSPKVRGVAMNPVDHPHGGWSNKGWHPTNPTGKFAKGVKTWHLNKWSWRKIFAPKAKLI